MDKALLFSGFVALTRHVARCSTNGSSAQPGGAADEMLQLSLR